MRKDLDDIEIKEPPLQELETQTRGSCLKRGLFVGCSGLIVLVIAGIAAVIFSSKPHMKELKDVPENFPTAIPVDYDKSNIAKITISKNRRDDEWISRLAYLPKKLLAPLVFEWQNRAPENVRNWLGSIYNSVKDDHTTVSVEWTDLPAEPKFVQNFYETALKKDNYSVTVVKETDSFRQINFNKDDIRGEFIITDDSTKSGTDDMIITIKLPL